VRGIFHVKFAVVRQRSVKCALLSMFFLSAGRNFSIGIYRPRVSVRITVGFERQRFRVGYRLVAADKAGGRGPAQDCTERKVAMPATKVKQKSKSKSTSKSKGITIAQIRNKAKALGIVPGKMMKTDLIHAIQMAEGYAPCFGRSNGECGYTACCFIRDCLKTRL